MSRRLLLGLLALGCAKHAADPLSSISLPPPTVDWAKPTPSGVEVARGYVGSAACRPCHAELYARYARHSMAQSGLRRVSTLHLESIFDHAAPVEDPRSGFSYQPLRKGDEYLIEERVLDKDGVRVQSRTLPVTHALSAGRYGMAFYSGSHHGRYHQAPIDYFPQAKRWAMDPGAVNGNPRFSKLLRSFCISCHSDYPERGAGSDQLFLEPPTGIGCERCHGPGERHVHSLRKEDVVNPARLATARQLDVCAQCHLSSHAELRAGRNQFDFRPGNLLDEVRVNFVAESAEPDRVELLAHSERLLRSACWLKSSGKLTCTRCHDPHKSSFDQPPKWWDDKCQACHQRCAANEKSDCVRCHMAKRAPWNPSLVTVTDHWIQRRPPPTRPGRPVEGRLITWSALLGEPLRGEDVPALEVLALADAGRSTEAEARAAQVKDSRLPGFYQFLARRFLDRKRPDLAARAWAALLRLAPEDRGGLMGYARLMLDKGDLAEALRALDRLLAVDSDDADVLELEGMALLRAGRIPEARMRLARATQTGIDNAAAWVGAAVLAKREGQPFAALLGTANDIEPGDPWILDQLSQAWRGHADFQATFERQRRHFRPRQLTSATNWLLPEDR